MSPALLRADPALVRNAVDEVLRYEPPAISSTCSTPVDIEVDGVVVPAGSNILVSVLVVIVTHAATSARTSSW